jgi:putative tryptophan/tyrosine transport system substrate-binding protein
VQLRFLDVRGAEDLESAFQIAARERPDALITISNPIMNDQRTRIVEFAAEHGLPAMHPRKEFVQAGGLMAYGISLTDMYRRGAWYVDKVLKGATPAEMPVERPMRFDFVINLQTAQALGLTIPPHVLLQATEVIQ